MVRSIVFGALMVAALGAFAATLRRHVQTLKGGRPDLRTDQWRRRWDGVLTFFFGQKKVIEQHDLPAKRLPAFIRAVGSRHHLIFFWGFMVLTLGTGELIIQGFFPGFALADVVGRALGTGLAVLMDIFCVAVLAMVLFAIVRRTVLQPRLIPMTRDAGIILGAIAFLMITHLGLHGYRTAAGHHEPGYFISERVPVLVDSLRALRGSAGGPSPLSTQTAHLISEVNYWGHMVTIFAFLNYLLYSKHSHIIAGLPNIFFRKLDNKGVLPLLNLEAEDIEDIGIVSSGEDFTWKHMLDGLACTECARCTNACPAYNTDKPLSPMQLIHDFRDDFKDRMARDKHATSDTDPPPPCHQFRP